MQITSISYESGRISQISVRSEFEDRGQTEHCLNVLPADQPMHNDPENALIPFDHIIVPYESKGSHLSETRKDKAIGAKTFKEDILILGFGEGNRLPAVANLDSACDAGNWVSHRLVGALGKLAEISPSRITPQLYDANGNRIESCGSISLTWRMYHNGIRWHKDEFFVLLPQGDAHDVIFGGQYLLDKDWVFKNEGAMNPMTEHKQKTLDEKKKIASLEEAQRREKANLESRRLKAQKAHKTSSSTSSDNRRAGCRNPSSVNHDTLFMHA